MKKIMLKAMSFLLVTTMMISFGNRTAVSPVSAMEIQEPLGTTTSCEGHILGTFSGVPACVNENGDLHICENNFPDENFRNLILGRREADDNYFTVQEIEKITSIGYQSNYGIESMKGIEFFSGLTSR